MHIWLMNKVWSLPTFFAEALARRKAFQQTAPLTKNFPRVQKRAGKVLLTLKTWHPYKSHSGTHRATATKYPLEDKEICETLQFGFTFYNVGNDNDHL